MENDALDFSVEKRRIHCVHAHLPFAGNGDSSGIHIRQSPQKLDGTQKLVHLDRFERRARHHGLALHVMQRIVVAEAAEIAFERAASLIDCFDNSTARSPHWLRSIGCSLPQTGMPRR